MLDKVKLLLEFPLVSQRKVRQFLDVIEGLGEYINNFYNDNPKKGPDNEDGDNDDKSGYKYMTKQEKEARLAQADAYDKFFTFFPFWDTRFCEGSKEDAVFLRR